MCLLNSSLAVAPWDMCGLGWEAWGGLPAEALEAKGRGQGALQVSKSVLGTGARDLPVFTDEAQVHSDSCPSWEVRWKKGNTYSHKNVFHRVMADVVVSQKWASTVTMEADPQGPPVGCSSVASLPAP